MKFYSLAVIIAIFFSSVNTLPAFAVQNGPLTLSQTEAMPGDVIDFSSENNAFLCSKRGGSYKVIYTLSPINKGVSYSSDVIYKPEPSNKRLVVSWIIKSWGTIDIGEDWPDGKYTLREELSYNCVKDWQVSGTEYFSADFTVNRPKAAKPEIIVAPSTTSTTTPFSPASGSSKTSSNPISGNAATAAVAVFSAVGALGAGYVATRTYNNQRIFRQIFQSTKTKGSNDSNVAPIFLPLAFSQNYGKIDYVEKNRDFVIRDPKNPKASNKYSFDGLGTGKTKNGVRSVTGTENKLGSRLTLDKLKTDITKKIKNVLERGKYFTDDAGNLLKLDKIKYQIREKFYKNYKDAIKNDKTVSIFIKKLKKAGIKFELKAGKPGPKNEAKAIEESLAKINKESFWKTAGKVAAESKFVKSLAKPLGRSVLRGAGTWLILPAVAMDGYSLNSAWKNDGQQFGPNMARTTGEVAGGWTGFAIGAYTGVQIGVAFGTLLAPGLGTAIGGLVGGLVGGIIGGIGGSVGGGVIGSKLYDARDYISNKLNNAKNYLRGDPKAAKKNEKLKKKNQKIKKRVVNLLKAQKNNKSGDNKQNSKSSKKSSSNNNKNSKGSRSKIASGAKNIGNKIKSGLKGIGNKIKSKFKKKK